MPFSLTSLCDAIDILGVSSWVRVDLSDEIDGHRAEIRSVLIQIADTLDSAYERHSYACVLGLQAWPERCGLTIH